MLARDPEEEKDLRRRNEEVQKRTKKMPNWVVGAGKSRLKKRKKPLLSLKGKTEAENGESLKAKKRRRWNFKGVGL